LYGLGVQRVKVWILLGAFSCQVWLQHLWKIFDLQSSHCPLLHSGHCLGSSLRYLLCITSFESQDFSLKCYNI
jgi:hypothetical protein